MDPVLNYFLKCKVKCSMLIITLHICYVVFISRWVVLSIHMLLLRFAFSDSSWNTLFSVRYCPCLTRIWYERSISPIWTWLFELKKYSLFRFCIAVMNLPRNLWQYTLVYENTTLYNIELRIGKCKQLFSAILIFFCIQIMVYDVLKNTANIDTF